MTTKVEEPPITPEPGPEVEPPARARQAAGLTVLRVVGTLVIPVVAFAVLALSYDYLRDADANRFLLVGVALVVGVGGVFFLYWAMNWVVNGLPERYREGVRPYVFVGPALVILAVFLVYPVINTIILSFADRQGNGLRRPRQLQVRLHRRKHAAGYPQHLGVDRDRAPRGHLDRPGLRHPGRPAPPGRGGGQVLDLPADGDLVRRCRRHLVADLQLPARGFRHQHRPAQRHQIGARA